MKTIIAMLTVIFTVTCLFEITYPLFKNQTSTETGLLIVLIVVILFEIMTKIIFATASEPSEIREVPDFSRKPNYNKYEASERRQIIDDYEVSERKYRQELLKDYYSSR